MRPQQAMPWYTPYPLRWRTAQEVDAEWEMSHTVVQAQQEAEVQDATQKHAARMADISSQHVSLEASAAARLQETQQQLASTAALSDTELLSVKERAAAAAEAQAAADAVKQKQQLLQESMKKVDEEVSRSFLAALETVL